ncbi:MAG: helix-turn-helix domain-containing protein [Liquorilactobacillus nagelii]|uniref:helix-turn-helix domain-containing protein n=1 Tax=Liquorilactobacillus nagelii TaxID=82688 RepID=UPI00243109D1|nr:helix-turn-helix transcriptional regulator [Liquorilactobacillus nagelii]MCI1633705.1 helix-turn-helix domain-containing protein [Liquorilactobacillus nagelii]
MTDDEDARKIGQRIVYIRKAKKIPQAVLAKRISISRSTLYNYENGSRTLPVTLVNKIAKSLDVPVTFILNSIPSYIDNETLLKFNAHQLNDYVSYLGGDKFYISKDHKNQEFTLAMNGIKGILQKNTYDIYNYDTERSEQLFKIYDDMLFGDVPTVGSLKEMIDKNIDFYNIFTRIFFNLVLEYYAENQIFYGHVPNESGINNDLLKHLKEFLRTYGYDNDMLISNT